MGKALIIAKGDLAETAEQLLISIGHQVDVVDNLAKGWEAAVQKAMGWHFFQDSNNSPTNRKWS